MTDELYDDEMDDTPPEEQPSHLRKQLSEKAKEAKAANERAEKAERQLALRDSGLDLNDPLQAFFADKYDGPMNAEAIREAATTVGVLSTPPPDVSDEDVAKVAEITAVAAGADPPAAEDNSWEQRAAQAGNQEEMTRILREAGVKFADEDVVAPST